MIVQAVSKHREASGSYWQLQGPLKETLVLPALTPSASGTLRLGLLGTRSSPKVKNKTDRFAGTIAALGCPVFLVDTRRNGTGGQGSWSPRELATCIPAMLPPQQPYSYMHLPIAAPSLALLEAAPPPPWQEFAASYREELPSQAVCATRAFAEAAHLAGGLAVLLCSEPRLTNFRCHSQQEQDAHYCHRYTLAQALVGAINAEIPAMRVELVELSMEDVAPALVSVSPVTSTGTR